MERGATAVPWSWPALVANQKFGAGVVNEATVSLQAPTHFIFRACTGAVAENLWSGKAGADQAGQADEWISDPPGSWIKPTPAQNLWLLTPGGLPNGKANGNINTVTLTIGGNDVGFAGIIKACIQKPFADPNPAKCQKTIADREAEFDAVKERIVTVLKDVAKKAPNARIAVPLYPAMIHPNGEKIRVLSLLGEAVYINDVVVGVDDLTAAGTMVRFISRLDDMVGSAVRKAAAGKVDVRVIASTYIALTGHRFGNTGAPWINGIIPLEIRESFHPNRCGQQALAFHVYRRLEHESAPPARCP